MVAIRLLHPIARLAVVAALMNAPVGAQEVPAPSGPSGDGADTGSTDAPANLLANGDFEEVAGRAPAFWHLYVLPDSGAAGESDRAAHSGGYSIRVEMPEAHPSNPVINWSQNIMADLTGKSVDVSGYIRTEEATEAALWLQCWANRPRRVVHGATTFDETPMYGTQDWRRVEMTVAIPEGTEFVTCRAILRGRGTAWFDDLRVAVAHKAGPTNARPAPAPPLALENPPDEPSHDAAPAAPASPSPPQASKEPAGGTGPAADKRAAQAAAVAASAEMNRRLGSLLEEPDEEFSPIAITSPLNGSFEALRDTSVLQWLLSPNMLPLSPEAMNEEQRR